MIDLHCHILPEIDDGPTSIDTSIEMAKTYVRCGYTTVVATPHWFGTQSRDADYARMRRDELQGALDNEQIPLTVRLGNEVMMTPESLDEIRGGKALPLADSQCLLFELPMWQKSLFYKEFVFQLKLGGYIPLLAHPERYDYLESEPDLIHELNEIGVLFQVNLPSFSGQYGEQIQKFAMSLLEQGLVYVVATDAHGINRRSPDVANELEFLRRTVGEEQTRLLTEIRPAALLDNHVLEATRRPVSLKQKRRVFPRFFGHRTSRRK